MVQLSIRYAYGNWWASPINSEMSFKFAGATAEDQAIQVRNLSAAMEEGEGALAENIGTIFSNYGSMTNEELIEELFATTTDLVYETISIFSATEGATLLEEIAAAGEALAAALA